MSDLPVNTAMDLKLEPSQQVLSPTQRPWPPNSPFKDQFGQTAVVVLKATMDPPPPVIDDETEKQIKAEARQFIQAKYDRDDPFFSKEALQDVADQLDRCLYGNDPTQKVALTALDGKVLHFLVEVGKESRSDWPGYKLIRTKPQLTYRTLHQLTSGNDTRDLDPERAYLAIDLFHGTEIREAATNKVVSPWPMPECEELRRDFQRSLQYWGNERLFAELGSILTKTGILPLINNVVAFSCGSITYLSGWPLQQRSMSQHALILAVRDLVERTGYKEPGTVKCYAQDPIYGLLDQRILGDEGIMLVNDPKGFLQVDEGSFVISILPGIPVHDVIADIARPVVMVATYPLSDHYVSPRAKDMLANEYVRMDFADHTCFHDTVMYIRKNAMVN